ncbi:MAG TPA: HAD family hydrolase [Acidimicrobiales bacterium]|nr:HAD family hydrolase [Acidimicrobiales bacterium]
MGAELEPLPHLSSVRLVATDLDGTLLSPSGGVTPRAREAVRAAREAGVVVVPVTGRPPQALWDLAEQAGLGPFGICANGAALVDIDRRAVVEVEPLAGEIAMGLVDLIRGRIPGIVLACDDLECFSYEPGFFASPVDWDEKMEETADIRSAVTAGCIKLIARAPDTDALGLIRLLEERVGEIGHVTTSGLDWVDIGAPGVSKAYALERLCERLDVHLSEVVAVGDNHNDLSFLAWAGVAMAPANAIPEVLAVAHRVLPHNGEDGVAALLEEVAAARGAQHPAAAIPPSPG